MKRSIWVVACIGLLVSAVAAGTVPKKVTIVDTLGRSVTVTAPITRIASVTVGASELICAMGAGDRIVGRDSYSTFPSSMLRVPQVAGSSYDPNLELVLATKPQVIIGDTMLKEPMISKLEAKGIAVIVDSPENYQRLIPLVNNLGLILDKQDKAKEVVGYIEGICATVSERMATQVPEDRPLVFYEWSRPYFSASSGGTLHGALVQAGGRNIAADEKAAYPQLSAEWVMRENPQVIVRMSSTKDLSAAQAAKERDEILARAELKNVKAVQDGRVNVINYQIMNATRYPIYLLYLAKWFSPELFRDVSPAAEYEKLVTRFFGNDEWSALNGIGGYPAP